MTRHRTRHRTRHALAARGARVAAVVAVATLSACSSGASNSSTTSTNRPAHTTTTTRAAPEVVAYDPDDEAFWTVPDPIPAGTHGDLLRTQPILDAPDGVSWHRILYRSTTLAGEPTVVTGILTIPDHAAPEGGWRLASHAHGSTGLADDCAPSRTVVSDPASSAELRVVGVTGAEHDTVVVSTDYEGQGGPGRHPFLVGASEGRAVLDAARAARAFPGLDLPPEVALVGYSQGGHAALWANQIAAEWTPELDVVGTVAGAPASEVADLIADGPVPAVDSPQALGIVAGLEAADPSLADDLAALLTDDGTAMLAALDAACGAPDAPSDPGPLLTADPTTIEPWKTLMADNAPGSVATDDPILVVHSQADESVPIGHSATLVARLCDAGQVVERRVLPTGTHVSAAVPTYTDGFAWLDGLAEGAAPVDACGAASPDVP